MATVFITVTNNTGAALSATQLRVDLHAGNAGAIFTASADGTDFVVTDMFGNALTFWRERYTQSGQVGLLWVKANWPTGESRVKITTGGESDLSSFANTMQKFVADADTLCHVDFDEGTGTPTDETATYTVTDVGVPTWAGSELTQFKWTSTKPSGDSYSFNGTSSAVNINGLLDGPWPDAGCVGLWFKPNAQIDTSGTRLWCKIIGTGTNGQVELWFNTNKLVLHWYANGTSYRFDPINLLGTNTFFTCVTWGPRGLELWIDGERVGLRTTYELPTGTVNRTFAIGCFNNGTNSNFSNVTIDEFFVKDVQPTTEQIRAWYERRKPIPSLSDEFSKLTIDASPIFEPTIAEEGTQTIEPDVVYDTTIAGKGPWFMFYTGGWTTSYTFLAHAASADGPWTKLGLIIGNGEGGQAGTSQRIGILKQNGQVVKVSGYYWAYSSDAVSTNANLQAYRSSDLQVWELMGKAIDDDVTVETGVTANGIANISAFIDSNGTPRMIYEYLQASPAATGSWRTATATGDVDDLATGWVVDAAVGRLDDLQRGRGMFGGPNMLPVGDQHHLWYHASISGGQPTFVARSYSYDLINWIQVSFGPTVHFTVPPFGSPTKEQDQAADPAIMEFDEETHFWWEMVDNSQQYSRIWHATYAGTLEQFITANVASSHTGVAAISYTTAVGSPLEIPLPNLTGSEATLDITVPPNCTITYSGTTYTAGQTVQVVLAVAATADITIRAKDIRLRGRRLPAAWDRTLTIDDGVNDPANVTLRVNAGLRVRR